MGRRKTKISVIPNTKEWERQRNALIGASDISALFQCNPWMTSYNLLAIKAGVNDPYPPTFRMEVGHYFEESIGKLTHDYSQGQDVKLATMERDNCIRIDYEQPYIAASLDFKGQLNTGQNYVLDAKCVGVNSYRTIKSTNLPSYAYWLQIQQQIMVTQKSLGTEVGYLATWAGNQMLKVFEIKPCPTTQDMIRSLCKYFYSEVEKLRRIASYDERVVQWNNKDTHLVHQTYYDFALQEYSPQMDDLVRNTSSLYLLVE